MLHSNHPAAKALDITLKSKDVAAPVLDNTDKGKQQNQENNEVMGNVAEFAMNDIALSAVAAVHEFAETTEDDLGEGEGLGDRLYALLVGIADEDMDGEINSDSDEAEVIQIAAEAAADYMISKGVPESDVVDLLTDFDNDLAANVQELLLSALPEGDDAALEEIDSFVFGADEEDEVLDAVYKKKWVVRKGKKVRINKRVSGRVRLSAKQKLGIKKALRKANTATAKMRRAKSNKKREQMGL